jgi:hypothetical protein
MRLESLLDTIPGFSRIGADRSGYSCIRRLTASSSAEGFLCGDEYFHVVLWWEDWIQTVAKLYARVLWRSIHHCTLNGQKSIAESERYTRTFFNLSRCRRIWISASPAAFSQGTNDNCSCFLCMLDFYGRTIRSEHGWRRFEPQMSIYTNSWMGGLVAESRVVLLMRFW